MLTETQARDLLHQAADTIDVGPPAPIAEPSRPSRTMVLTAAAAVCLLVLIGLVVWRAQQPGPAERPQGRTTVPRVYWYPVNVATRLLRSHGLEPRVRTTLSCRDAGRVQRTEPGAGAAVERGSTVTLVVAGSGAERCLADPTLAVSDKAWELVDLALGVGPKPTFADHVLLGVNSQPPVFVSAARAADPAAWPSCDAAETGCAGSALDVLRESLAPVVDSQRFLVRPELMLTRTSDDLSSFAFRFGIVRAPDEPLEPFWSISEELDSAGAVTAVRLDYRSVHQSRQPPSEVTGPDPTRIGHRFVAFARGASVALPTTREIRLMVQHNWLRSMSASEVRDRKQWRFCPTLAARCGFSAPDVIERSSRPVAAASPPAAERCFRRAGGPATVPGADTVVAIRPEQTLPCSRAWAVYLYGNDLGQIVAVDLMLHSRE